MRARLRKVKMNKEIRTRGLKALIASNKKRKDFTQKQLRNIEKKVVKLEKEEESYLRVIFQIVGMILDENPDDEILEKLNSKSVGWNLEEFDEYEEDIKENDDYIMNPFEVVEGAVVCNKCGSKKLISFSKQTRGCDEESTVFVQCFGCSV